LHRIVELLLKSQADPNVQQSDGNTPLHLACFKGDEITVELLLRHAADPNVPNNAVF
jgi:ankyrin repeat protein